jgi:hypothetical protein
MDEGRTRQDDPPDFVARQPDSTSCGTTDMRLWDRLVLSMFPGSLEEYREARKIHHAEMRRYRTQPQFIAGILLFAGAMMYLVGACISRGDWGTGIALLCITIGLACVHNTISEHYCLLLSRLGYGKEQHLDASDTRWEVADLVARGSTTAAGNERPASPHEA